MPKENDWFCVKCGAWFDTTLATQRYNKKCPDCGGDIIETPYEGCACIMGTDDLEPEEVMEDIIENYAKPNPQYDPELWAKRRRGERIAKSEPVTFSKSKQEQQNTNVPRCPTCGSTNIARIGTAERGVSVGLFGLFSSKIGKTMKCKNCGYKW